MPYTKTFPSLTFLPVLTFSEFLAFTNLIVPHCGFYVPDHQQSGALCICLLAIQGSFSIKGFLCSFIPSVIIVVIIIIIIILQYWVGFFVLTYGSSLCLQDTNPCHPFAFANIFFQSSACLFTLFMVFLDVQMFLNFSIVKDQLYFYVCFNFVTQKNHTFFYLKSQDILPVLSISLFKIFAVHVWNFHTPFNYFVYGVKQEPILLFSIQITNCPSNIQ